MRIIVLNGWFCEMERVHSDDKVNLLRGGHKVSIDLVKYTSDTFSAGTDLAVGKDVLGFDQRKWKEVRSAVRTPSEHDQWPTGGGYYLEQCTALWSSDAGPMLRPQMSTCHYADVWHPW